MHKINNIAKPSVCIYCIVIVLFFTLSGCAGLGRIVFEGNRIYLSNEQNKEGVFTDGFNSLNYSYSLDRHTMAIKGEVFASGSVSTLKVRLLLLDEKGAIVEGLNIFTSGYRNYHMSKDGNAFAQTIALPNDVTAISFDFYVEYRTRR